MPIAQGDVLRVAARMKRGAIDDLINVYHVRIDFLTSGTDQGVLDSVNEYLEGIYTPLVPHMSNNYLFIDQDYFNVTQGVPLPVQTWATLVAGTSVAQQLSDGVAALFNSITGVSGKQGKKYMGAFTEDAVNEGLFQGAVLVALASAGVAYGALFVSTGFDNILPVIYTRFTGLSDPILQVVLNTIPAYQRRRKRGVGS